MKKYNRQSAELEIRQGLDDFSSDQDEAAAKEDYRRRVLAHYEEVYEGEPESFEDAEELYWFAHAPVRDVLTGFGGLF